MIAATQRAKYTDHYVAVGNRMLPPAAPLGLDYVGAAVRKAGIDVELLDLCWVDNTDDVLRRYFAARAPELIGVSFRNVDDCFWPSGASFVPDLAQLGAGCDCSHRINKPLTIHDYDGVSVLQHDGQAIMRPNVDPQPAVDSRADSGRNVDAWLSNEERPGALPPSLGATRSVMRWIDHAHSAQRSWARNTLAIVLIFTALLFFAMWCGVIR